MYYPKIETLFKRDEKTHKVIEGLYRRQEFKALKYWAVTEKVDGMNIRVVWDGDKVRFGGRTDKAALPTKLYNYLTDTFTKEKMEEVFPENYYSDLTLFGEGYGSGIQSGGNYRQDQSFMLFDVFIDIWWLKFEDVEDIAKKLGIDSVPLIGYLTTEEAIKYVKCAPAGTIGLKDTISYTIEGIVATSIPLMLFRNCKPLRWKLKVRDF